MLEAKLVFGAALEQRGTDAVVEIGDAAEKLGGLAQAAGEEKDQGAGFVQGFQKAEQGDDCGLAGLPTAVEEEARVLAFENLDLPGIGVEAEETQDFGGRRSRHGGTN